MATGMSPSNAEEMQEMIKKLLKNQEEMRNEAQENDKRIKLLTETVQQLQVAITIKTQETEADALPLVHGGAKSKTKTPAPTPIVPKKDPFSMIELLQCEPIKAKSPIPEPMIEEFCPPEPDPVVVAKEKTVTLPPPSKVPKLVPHRDNFRSMEHIQCFGCEKYGHVIANCHSAANVDQSRDIQCYRCEKFGHKSADCYSSLKTTPKVDSPREDSLSLAQIKCYRCQRTGHSTLDCCTPIATKSAQPRSDSRSLAHIQCFGCGKYGHVIADCYAPAKTTPKLDSLGTLPHVKCFRCDKYGHKSFDCATIAKKEKKRLERQERLRSLKEANDCALVPYDPSSAYQEFSWMKILKEMSITMEKMRRRLDSLEDRRPVGKRNALQNRR